MASRSLERAAAKGASGPQQRSKVAPAGVMRSGGEPLDASTRAFFEPRFGHDFSAVRVFSRTESDHSARSLNADAYTLGSNIVFASGHYAPGTFAGRRLIAHELTHVVQQTSTGDARRFAISPAPVSIQRDSAQRKFLGTGSKALSKGVMTWDMRADEGGVNIQIVFSPSAAYRGKPITFLQTLLRTRTKNPNPSLSPVIDILTAGREGASADDRSPFYGAEWDDASRSWKGQGAPAGFRNQPGSRADPNAYLYDAPVAFAGQAKLFESAVVVPETGEILAAISWGIRGNEGETELLVPDSATDVTDRPTAGLLVAVDRFYALPSTPGPDPTRAERYDAIVDGFASNDASLTTGQHASLEPLVQAIAGNANLGVAIAGFADATERDPGGISEARVRSVESYLVARGVPRRNLGRGGFFGAAWVRYPPGPAEWRNRRVQLRLQSLPSTP